MIIYRVEITLDAGIESEWLDWMKRVHVPDVVRTGCFSEYKIYKVIDSTSTEPVYVIAVSMPIARGLPPLPGQFCSCASKEHSDRFAGRFRGSRQLLEEVSPTIAA
jgi:hypothetical protein